jgi:NADH-quinone oxidoreductase subunit C
VTEIELLAVVEARFAGKILATYSFRGQAAVTVAPSSLREVLVYLRDEHGFDMLMDVAGVDYLGYPDWENDWRYEVAYQMFNTKGYGRFRVKVAVTEEANEVPSVWDLWGIANWMEREVYDMFGVRFAGHPNLRRILCHDQFEGHALRKDYPIQKRQKLSEPSENILCEKVEYA